METTVTAVGTIESAKSTIIRCELERLDSGRLASFNGSSTIIDLVPEATNVRRGDILCRLDSSSYEQSVLQQRIAVERARAACTTAEYDLEGALLALQEYREGLMPQSEQQLAGQIATAFADLQRRDERLAWSKRMLGKGYVAASRVAVEEQARMRAAWELERLRSELAQQRRHSAPRELRSLEVRVAMARTGRVSGALRLRHEEEKLARFLLQVDRCTIRAPHDGLLIYADKPGRPARILLGAPVWQRQKLFFLPDLSRIEVHVLLHETVVDRVRPNMPVRVRPESSPQRILRGRVLSVSPLPASDHGSQTGNEVKYYVGRIGLDAVPQGLRLGMTAEVSIVTMQPGALGRT